MTRNYNGLDVLKPIEDLYLSIDAMKSVLSECTSKEIAVVEIDFYVREGEAYVLRNKRDSFEYTCQGQACHCWNDYVRVCNTTALGALSKNKENVYCSYVLLKTN